MSYDRPGPQAVEVQLQWVTFSARLFQRVNRPHREIRHEQECHQLATWFFTNMIRRCGRSSTSIKDEHRLERGFNERSHGGDQYENGVLFQRQMGADDGEGAVEKRSSLTSD